jgi:hypothetical protein
MCPSRPTFFGLGLEYIQSVYEEIFLLKYYGNWSFTESYNLPILIRRWFLNRLVEQKEKEKEELEKSQKKAGKS